MSRNTAPGCCGCPQAGESLSVNTLSAVQTTVPSPLPAAAGGSLVPPVVLAELMGLNWKVRKGACSVLLQRLEFRHRNWTGPRAPAKPSLVSGVISVRTFGVNRRCDFRNNSYYWVIFYKLAIFKGKVLHQKILCLLLTFALRWK